MNDRDQTFLLGCIEKYIKIIPTKRKNHKNARYFD